jgi:hypothetical protein
MTAILEKVARGICEADCGRVTENEMARCRDLARAALEALREPSAHMVRQALVETDLTPEQMDFGAEVLEGMPPARPDLQISGIEAAADMYRDWQAMIDAALAEQPA